MILKMVLPLEKAEIIFSKTKKGSIYRRGSIKFLIPSQYKINDKKKLQILMPIGLSLLITTFHSSDFSWMELIHTKNL